MATLTSYSTLLLGLFIFFIGAVGQNDVYGVHDGMTKEDVGYWKEEAKAAQAEEDIAALIEEVLQDGAPVTNDDNLPQTKPESQVPPPDQVQDIATHEITASLILQLVEDEEYAETALKRMAGVLEEALQDGFLVTDNDKLPQTKPELVKPSPKKSKLDNIDLSANEISPSDMRLLLEDDKLLTKLLQLDGISEIVKEYIQSRHSPALSAVVPTRSVKPVIGSSKALSIKDILLGLDPFDINQVEFSKNEFVVQFHDHNDGLIQDGPRRKIKCVPKARNITDENNTTISAQVIILNSTELMDRLGSKNESSNHCALVLFYAPWCVFSAKAAPHFNALARVFPQLDVFAINAAHFSKFGTVAVPNILIFHNAKAVARFNNSERVLENIASFVTNVTGLQGNLSVTVEEEDYVGPLPSQPSDDPDYLLWLSWIFIITFSSYMFSKSTTGAALFDYIGHLGHIEHQHIE